MLAGIGLAIVGFIVVIVVCAVILALLAAILPSYEGRTRAEQREQADVKGLHRAMLPSSHPRPIRRRRLRAHRRRRRSRPLAPDGEGDPAA